MIRCQGGCANISSIQMPKNSPRVPDICNPEITVMQVNKHTSSATTSNIQLALTQILQVIVWMFKTRHWIKRAIILVASDGMQVTYPTVTSRSAHIAAGYSAWTLGDLSHRGRQGQRNTVGLSAVESLPK